jgi:cell division septum initiation protein DivIVA
VFGRALDMPCGDWAAVFLSECLLSMRGYSPVRNGAADMNEVMEQLAARLLTLELQDRRCVAEARRNRANKALFRPKMLEHRRLQAQMAQLQRYRESALAHMDAVSNHSINQTFLRAIQGTVSDIKATDVTAAVDELHGSISSIREISELLGQPLAESDEITDEDLESEFMEFTTLETITEAPALLPPPVMAALQPVELRAAAFELLGR